jgi:ParB family chromosome partitioning protein
VLKLWNKATNAQLSLLDATPVPAATPAPAALASCRTTTHRVEPAAPQMVPVAALCEDPNNPRTEFPEAELNELAEDIRQHGVLQPIVVQPADEQGRHRIHFGAKRWRAAQRAGLTEVPVVMRDAPTDPYTQVAENQQRHGLTPLDLARFIKSRVDVGESNATVAKRLGMNLTTLAHHLSLLELPTVLDQALKAGRCTSPRTLHELSKLYEIAPDRVRILLAGDAEITRQVVSELKGNPAPSPPMKAFAQADGIARANAACDRLERILAPIDTATSGPTTTDLVALQRRVAALARCWSQGSDRQTPTVRKGSDSPTPARPT